MRSAPITEITAHDRAGQLAFCEYAPKVFPSIAFDHWVARGNWDDDYRAFTVMEDGRVVANVSVATMRVVVGGAVQTGFQLGAVGCLPEQRGRGLARAVMDAALDFCGSAPVLLFANPTVLDFYPRFGFAPHAQHRFSAEHVASPDGQPAATLAPWTDEGRSQLMRRAAAATAVTERFGALGYGSVIDWYVANRFVRPLRRLVDGALVFCAVEGDTLHVDDVLADAPFDLAAALPSLIDRPIASVEFGFSPERWWWGDVRTRLDDDADLFLRAFPAVPASPSQFPALART